MNIHAERPDEIMPLNFERLSTKINWVSFPNIIKRQLVVRSFASFLFAGILMPMSISTSATLPTVMQSKVWDNSAKSQNTANLLLDTNSAFAVTVSKKVSEIKPGDSVDLREQQAKIKAQADAAAKAKALQTQRDAISRERRVYNDPSDFGEIYNAAGAAFGVDPKILQAIHIVETGASGSTSRANPSGAQGPMQFLPSTWRSYGVDGNGDGIADINNVNDAIFAAARYLKACGYPDVKKALWGYNPSSRYFTKVIGIAQSLGYEG